MELFVIITSLDTVSLASLAKNYMLMKNATTRIVKFGLVTYDTQQFVNIILKPEVATLETTVLFSNLGTLQQEIVPLQNQLKVIEEKATNNDKLLENLCERPDNLM